MKTQESQILQMLQAFDTSAVLEAFRLYKEKADGNADAFKNHLEKNGWVPQDDIPVGRVYYAIDGKFWVLADEAREKTIKKAMEKHAQTKAKPEVKTSMALKRVELRCQTCGGWMYKQAVCPGCKDGKKGYRVRLICEDNPDHEVLL